MYRNEPKYKRRLNISSLNAAICNVAVFKSMKERQFKDEIYISYSEEGVLLEANSQQQWEKANRYVENFLTNKKISLLAFGYEKEIYEELIIKGLKDYTRRMKELGEECPYINIIHHQKLRKSCEYMDKEHYVEPLKDWERKNKKNPNFAFLIVQPIHKYEDVKRRLLEYLLKRQVTLNETYVSPLYFLLLFFTSSIKEEIKQNFERTLIEITLQKTKDKNWRNENGEYEQYRVRLINYSLLKLNEIDYKIVNSSKNLTRLGLQFISSKEIQTQIKKIKQFLTGSAFSNRNEIVPVTQPFELMQLNLIKKYGEDYCIIPFKKSEREKYHVVINKFINKTQEKNINEINEQIEKNIICGFDQIEFLAQVYPQNSEQRGYEIHKVCLNDCPYMIHAYQHVPISEIDTFLLYIEQLKTYSCTYLVRFYGISLKYGRGIEGQIPADMSAQQKIEGYTYYLIFDYHHRTFQLMMDNDMILDNFQVAQMILQIIYLINFLHTHEEPRSLGELKIDQIYWPLRIVLPYLKNNDEKLIKKEDSSKKDSIKGHYRAIGEGFEGDVRLAGLIMKVLLETGLETGKQAENEDDHFSDILQSMLKDSKYERITLIKCISNLEELLLLN